MPSDKNGIDGIFGIFRAVFEPELLIDTIINGENPQLVRGEIDKLIDSGMRCESIKAALGEQFEPSVWSYDADTALLNWKKAQQSNFIGKAINSGKCVKELAVYAKDPRSVTKENIAGILGTLSEYGHL